MSEQQEIARLENEIRQRKDNLQRNQSNCCHVWDPTKYDPENYQDAHFSHYEGHGSDPHAVYNYVTKQKPRWSRYCRKCEKTEYTYEQKAVKYEPKF